MLFFKKKKTWGELESQILNYLMPFNQKFHVEFTYHVIPGKAFVVDDGGAETPGRVDAGSGDGDGC